MKNAVIFDLDGTLWDSTVPVTQSWNEVLGRYPESAECKISVSDMRGFMGKQMDEIAVLMMPKVEENLRRKIMLECMDFEIEYLKEHKPVFYPGLAETLETLAEKYALAIVSNCQDGYIQLFLNQLDKSGLFCDFECYGRTWLSKGENISLVIKRNEIGKAVYLGDTQGDLDAADFAGVDFIHAAYGFGKPTRKTEKIARFSDLTAACRTIFGE